MDGTIEITVRTVPGGKILTNVKGKKCSEDEILAVMQTSFCAMAASVMKDVPQQMRKKCCRDFGEMVELQMMEQMSGGKHVAQRFEGREAAFISELLTRQEGQNE